MGFINSVEVRDIMLLGTYFPPNNNKLLFNNHLRRKIYYFIIIHIHRFLGKAVFPNNCLTQPHILQFVN